MGNLSVLAFLELHKHDDSETVFCNTRTALSCSRAGRLNQDAG
jgi:hypothetical protein